MASSDIKIELTADAQKALADLDDTFSNKSLPDGLDLAITDGHGTSIGTRSPFGAGHRQQGEIPITLVDEIERGLGPYRQVPIRKGTC
jgi:putative ATP-dependent endonuclease of OLD family